jgi:hypothetical protein
MAPPLYGSLYGDPAPAPIAAGGFRIAAVLVGWVVDIIGSLVVGLVMGLVFGIAYARSGMSPQAMAEAFASSPVVLGISLVIGFGFTLVGGFVAAHMGRSAPLKHAFGMGVLSTVFGLFSSLISPKGTPVYAVLGIGLTIPAAMLGGVIRRGLDRTQ